MNIPTSKVTLLYVCERVSDHESGQVVHESQPLDDVVESGTLICSECECLMVLDDNIEVQE